ncbi:MAG: hypothetical protein KGJ62_11725 [Armatimonadetes bacterium]|nr:hypothetical protein [Armatimonadota bacterium]MDE2207910.1 hypothetical protein [Armatimonadota bacterium]
MKQSACVFAIVAGAGLVPAAGASPLSPVLGPVRINGLQLNIVAPGNVTGDTTVPLSVSFNGANLQKVELLLDGVLIKDQAVQTHDGHGIIRFELDPTVLSPGEHQLQIKAWDVRGGTAQATARMMVGGASIGDAIARVTSPFQNSVVQGVVPIQVRVDAGIQNPYVSFLVDNQWQALGNYAPFTYNWDSTTVPNGPHLLSVQVFDGASAAAISTLSFRVRVNNPGGFTSRLTTMPDLSRRTAAGGAAAAPVVHGIAAALAPVAAPAKLAPIAAVENLAHLTGAGRYGNSMRPAAPFANVPAPAVSAPAPHGAAPAPHASSAFGGILSNSNAFVDMVPSVAPAPIHLARLSARPQPGGNIAARPSLGSDHAASPTHTAPALALVPAGAGVHGLDFLAPNGPYGLDFNGTELNFDVLPRVVHGVPLAPFRQIFEYTGGSLQWLSRSKQVVAKNSVTSIQFKIGARGARVNDRALTLEQAPFIDSGRAIVPVSFVREALNVTVSYDPVTGHLLLENRK